MMNYENVFNSNELIKSGNGYSAEFIITLLNKKDNKNNTISGMSNINPTLNKVSDIYKDRAIPASLYLNSFFLSEMNEDGNMTKQKDDTHYNNSEVISDDLYNKLLQLSNTTSKKNKKLTKKNKGKKENKEKKGKKTRRNYEE